MTSPYNQTNAGSPDEVQADQATTHRVLGLIALGLTIDALADELGKIMSIPFKIIRRILSLIHYSPRKANTYNAFTAAYVITASYRVYSKYESEKGNLIAVPSVNTTFTPRPVVFPDEGRTLDQIVEAEKGAAAAHLATNDKRATALAEMRYNVQRFGDVLGWYAHDDDRTTPACALADGNNFRASEGTVIGLPGSVHRYCRCRSGKPHANGGWVNDAVDSISRQGVVA